MGGTLTARIHPQSEFQYWGWPIEQTGLINITNCA